MTNQIYTIGYSGRKPEEVKRIVEELGAVLFDIRFSPRSRDPRWAGGNVAKLLGANYRHVRELGNINYKGGPIAFVDLAKGIDLIRQAERPVVLMCVCKDHHTCHRAAAAETLREQGFEVTEITTRPAQASLFWDSEDN